MLNKNISREAQNVNSYFLGIIGDRVSPFLIIFSVGRYYLCYNILELLCQIERLFSDNKKEGGRNIGTNY